MGETAPVVGAQVAGTVQVAVASVNTGPVLDCAVAATVNIRVVLAEVVWQQENIDTVPGPVAAVVRGSRSAICQSAASHYFQTAVVHCYADSAGSNNCYSCYQIQPRMCEFMFCQRPFLQRGLL